MEPQPTEPPRLASLSGANVTYSCHTPDTPPSSTPSPASSDSDTSQPRPPASPRATRRVDILARRLSHHHLLEQQDSSADNPPLATSLTPASNTPQHLAADELPVQLSAQPDQFPPYNGPHSTSLDLTSSQWLVSRWLETRPYPKAPLKPLVQHEAPQLHLTPMGPKQTIVADNDTYERPLTASHGFICPDVPADVDEGIGDDMDSEPPLPPISLAELRSSRQARHSASATPADNGMCRPDRVYKAPRMRKRSSKKRTRDVASPDGGHSEQDVKRRRADQVA